MLNRLASLAMSNVLEALPVKLEIKRHSPSILYIHDRKKRIWMRTHNIVLSGKNARKYVCFVLLLLGTLYNSSKDTLNTAMKQRNGPNA